MTWKNEGFNAKRYCMDYNPQKMKVLGVSRGCETSSKNVAWLKGIVFFHLVVAGFCSSSQKCPFF